MSEETKPSYGEWVHAFLRAITRLTRGQLDIEDTVKWADTLYEADSIYPPEEIARREFDALQTTLPAELRHPEPSDKHRPEDGPRETHT